MIAIAFMAINATAQRGDGQRKDLSAEDQATLQTKKMTLALVLDESQANKVYQINLEQAKKRVASREARKKNKDESLTQEQRLALREQALDDRIAVQNKMQKILSEEQFKQWRTLTQKRTRGGKGKRGEGKGKRGKK